MDDHAISIEDYSTDWPLVFEKEKNQIKKVTGDLAIEHIGSTSVPGLSAKPVIDIMGAVQNIDETRNYVDVLANLGYKYIPELESHFPNRRFFQKRTDKGLWYHFSFVEPTDPFWIDHILFRDY